VHTNPWTGFDNVLKASLPIPKPRSAIRQKGNNTNAKSHLPQIRALLCQSFHKRQTGLEATLHRSAAQATLAELHRTRMTNGNGEVSAK
jgi:hypothetical protein